MTVGMHGHRVLYLLDLRCCIFLSKGGPAVMASCRSVARQQLSRLHLACPRLSDGSRANGTPPAPFPGAMMRAPRLSRTPRAAAEPGARISTRPTPTSRTTSATLTGVVDGRTRSRPRPSLEVEAGLMQGGRSMCERLAVGPGTRRQYTVLFMTFQSRSANHFPGVNLFLAPPSLIEIVVLAHLGRPPPAAPARRRRGEGGGVHPRRPAGCARGVLDASSSTSPAWVPKALPARQPLRTPSRRL